MDFIWGVVSCGVLALVWFAFGLLNARDKEREAELEELSGVVNVRRNTKDKLRNDPEYSQRVRDAFNDNTD